jgi:L-lactate utilization protein LutB
MKMKMRELLFVTYHDESFEEGLSYAIDLAKVMNDAISLLMIYQRKVMEKAGDVTTVVSFAETDEVKTSREMIKEDYERKKKSYEERLKQLMEKCREAGVPVDISTAATDAVSAVKNLLRQNTSIDMVLLSPNITKDKHISARELNRLVKTASRPIVTMAKTDHAA